MRFGRFMRLFLLQDSQQLFRLTPDFFGLTSNKGKLLNSAINCLAAHIELGIQRKAIEQFSLAAHAQRELVFGGLRHTSPTLCRASLDHLCFGVCNSRSIRQASYRCYDFDIFRG